MKNRIASIETLVQQKTQEISQSASLQRQDSYGASGYNNNYQIDPKGYDNNLNYPSFNLIFIDVMNSDFRLRPTSPAIDKGINIGLKRDYAGNKVPSGNMPDIGAFEYVDTLRLNFIP